MDQYKELIGRIVTEGRQKGDRTGTGTRAVFGHMKRYRLLDGLPILGLKKTFWKGIKHEFRMFMRGSTNNGLLTKHGVNIWSEWESPEGELGPVYSAMWRRWPVLGYEPAYIKIRTSEDTTEVGDIVSFEDSNYLEDGSDQEFMYCQNDRFKYEKQFLLWTYLIRSTNGKHKSSMLAETFSKSTICKAWHSFEQFRYDLSEMPGYELWLQFPNKYIMSCTYFGSSLLSRDTALFVNRSYQLNISSTFGNCPAKVTNVSTGMEYTLSTLLDLEEVTGINTEVGILAYQSLLCDDELDSVPLNNNDPYYNECPELGQWNISTVNDLDNDTIIRRRLYIDQLGDVIKGLKTNPESRRSITCGWNPELLPDTTKSFEENANRGKQVLPPCHTLFQFNTFEATDEEKIEWWLSVNPDFKFDLTHQQIEEILADIDTPKYTLDCFLFQREQNCALYVKA
jgi:thymidylate synthase